MVLTSTPVALTVVATILAAVSSSEMTLAQYHRALAAQNQSKASDQWNFFQFKRSRGMMTQLSIDFFHALSYRGSIKAETWQVSDRLLEDLRKVEKEANALLERLRQAKASPTGDRLMQRLAEFASQSQAFLHRAESLKDQLSRELGRKEVQHALAVVETKELPPAKINRLEEPAIAEALKAVANRQSESETAPAISKIPETTLRQAIDLLEANVQAVEEANKPISDLLSRLDTLLQQQTDLADDLHQAALSLKRTNGGTGDSPAQNDVLQALGRLVQSTAETKKLAQDFSNEFKVAQYGYAVRRYETEARHNQKAAELYEVQIRRSSTLSEKHRDRSRHFFYGMLVAQAGVTIASFSLAMKHRSFFWSLAGLAGLGAVVFSSWVYLYK
jgi:hypothetical protein